ncbi:MAG: DUF4998 domain-containing protein [Prevotella sp.]
MKKYIFAMSAAALMSSCGESLFDTYKDYAGDGEIRYVGKVTDLVATPGWQHITVSWTNSNDPIVDKVEVKWVEGETRDSVFLPVGTSSYDIKDLTTGSTYEISVMSVDKNMKESIAQTTYTRPYNADHELVQSFTRIVSKNYFLHNHLLLTFVGWSEEISEAYIVYTQKSSGKEVKYELTPETVNSLLLDLPDVDATKPVLLYRNGYLQGCDDLIVNEPITLDADVAFDAEFKSEMKRQFGYDQIIPQEWADNVTSLDIDWNMSNLLDLFKLPKLKTLNLGKNRYVRADQQGDTEKGQSRFVDNEVCDWVLMKMHELTGLEVNRYDGHYNKLASASYIHDVAHSGEPTFDMIDLSNATVTMMPADDEELVDMGWSSHPEYLVDGDEGSLWNPYMSEKSVEYTLDIDMKATHKVRGMRLVQSYYDDANASFRSLSPAMVKIYKSSNGSYYPVATFTEETTIGNSTGEVNYINFAEATDIQYVRIVVLTPSYFKNYQVSLAEVGLYK